MARRISMAQYPNSGNSHQDPTPAPDTLHLMADLEGKPLDERLEEIGTQLAWVRDYL